MEQFVYKNHKKLRYGYTTGSCAAAASKAAAAMLLSGKEISYVELHTPKGIDLRLEVLDISREDNAVSCAIQKDGGDDPDVTNGILIYAKVSREPADEAQIIIDGGIGVGRVTKPGLEQPVGAAAINKVPRQMIRENLEAVCEQYHYHGKLSVVISIPSGVELAAKTFNPRLGIVGGISVLGTSGIVEPMSEQALIDTIRVEMRQKLANGMEYLLVVPGNYGIDFLDQYGHGLQLEDAVKCSNFVGEALDAAVEFGAKGVLLVGHIGKFVKLAGGIMNTHSHNADARMELLTVHAALLGAPVELLQKMMECVTTDDALKYLKEADLMEPVMERIMEKMEFYVNQRAQHQLELGVITFSNVFGILGQTKNVPDLVKKIGRDKT
ncbi:cobalt-precorrin-5B (C(1))-methyltransferase CbiD [Hominiventricola aquisgranensis]|jgi:cobalt-precorrin-5B (C1)-methyltransferase|uniref:Cobalt-precorrin-5B C(1)-methyltransferase n=1 Tax=Hominiventricola aquisgranensis TaxID=3133164 RepID=A0ABV1HX49_9FIRM|nr:cobalamin biosynthesis protein CbiD [Clostridiales bacterium AM23-16LB]RHO83820.1 cobalamin biosynthesis protein CbiD [Clostridiaceae bacterium AF42-6]RHP49372.1 cobalamin biosynthesis protein CbiD [Clostridiaceae bacterium AF31-3BH]RHR45832.1 cobalamin biosynthesis protein CbiD [Clostridiaceae bacterium AF18-31LB]RHT85347.1 cobalamin biosynthesis protein CbiD [Clostridiaceae bacterium AM27-36LB]RHW03997.1 cobalamin biosynthesis protein CbiD [Clostridiaceae bacterium OF09-1]